MTLGNLAVGHKEYVRRHDILPTHILGGREHIRQAILIEGYCIVSNASARRYMT